MATDQPKTQNKVIAPQTQYILSANCEEISKVKEKVSAPENQYNLKKKKRRNSLLTIIKTPGIHKSKNAISHLWKICAKMPETILHFWNFLGL